MSIITAPNVDDIKSSLTKHGYCEISNWQDPSVLKGAREDYLKAMSTITVSPPKQKFSYKDLVAKPHRKYTIGATNGLGESYAALLQTTYFSKDDPAYSNLGKVFSDLINLRNRILGVAEDFGNNPERDGFWNACRIHHYPRGTGFMVGHRDTHFPALLEKAGHPFLQVLVVLSTRGTDFHSGGGFVVDRSDNKILYENENSFGNIVCFDGSIIHGVEDVDNDQILDFNQGSGRVAGFVNLYKVLS